MNDALAVARLVGDKTYEGSPCKRCTETLRYSTNQGCVKCSRARIVEGTQARNAQKHLDMETRSTIPPEGDRGADVTVILTVTETEDGLSVDKAPPEEQFLRDDEMNNPWD